MTDQQFKEYSFSLQIATLIGQLDECYEEGIRIKVLENVFSKLGNRRLKELIETIDEEIRECLQ